MCSVTKNFLNLVIMKQFQIVVCLSNTTMASRPTLAQIETLVEFLEQNPGIAKGLLRTTQAKMETKRKWEYLATTLNSLGGANMTGQGWAKYWAEKKCALKKLCAQHSASVRRTGGGPADNLPELSALDTRLVAVLGGQDFAVGDSRLAVDPFPQLSQEVQLTAPLNLTPADDTQMQTVGDSLVIIPMSPIAGPSEEAQIQTPPPHTRSQTPPAHHGRRHRSATRRINGDMDRLAQIEERRVNAETLRAQAYSDVTAALSNNVEAVANIANAMNEIARALEGLTAIANAILLIAQAMQR